MIITYCMENIKYYIKRHITCKDIASAVNFQLPIHYSLNNFIWMVNIKRFVNQPLFIWFQCFVVVRLLIAYTKNKFQNNKKISPIPPFKTYWCTSLKTHNYVNDFVQESIKRKYLKSTKPFCTDFKSSTINHENWNVHPLVTSLIVMMLWCLTYLEIAFNIGCDSFSAKGLFFAYSRIFSFLTAFKKKIFKSAAILASFINILSL